MIEPSPLTAIDGALRVGELRADRGRQAVAHRAEAAARQVALGPANQAVLGDPHLVLTDVAGDGGLAVRPRPSGGAAARAHRSRRPARRSATRAAAFMRRQCRRQAPMRGRCAIAASDSRQVAGQRDLGTAQLVDLGGVDVEVDHPRAGREPVELAGGAVVEARADHDQQVGLPARRCSRRACRACPACRGTADRRWARRRGPSAC